MTSILIENKIKRLRLILYAGIISSLMMFVFSYTIQSFLITTIVHTVNIIVAIILLLLSRNKNRIDGLTSFIVIYYFFMFIGNWSSLNLYTHSTRMLAIYLTLLIEIMLVGKMKRIAFTVEGLLILIFIFVDLSKSDVNLVIYFEVIISSFIVGAMILAVWKIYDYQLNQSQLHYHQLSITDPLTGAYNNRKFRINHEQCINDYNSDKTVYTIAILDIDYFKKINDKYGHKNGDFILKHLVNVLKNELSTLDIVHRYGGDEFIILLTDTHENEAFLRLEKCLQTLRNKPVYIRNETVFITVSIGIIDVDHESNDMILLKKADRALYQCKANGRDGLLIYED